MTKFQKVALAALISVILLIFVGAIVRVTGAGMGCPDWPRCWGCLIPPTSVDKVDFSKLDLEKFRRKAARAGRDSDTITMETLRREFNPVHVWTEYVNRLCSLPVGLFTLATCIAGFFQIRRGRAGVALVAFAALVVVLVNAWMGARIVYSGLKPGIITAHMALALLLLCLQVYTVWRGCDRPWRREIVSAGAALRALGVLLLIMTLAEGVLGSQVREMTDELARSHAGEPRAAWTAELEGRGLYLIHRSFSWVLVAGTAVFLAVARGKLAGGLGWLEKLIGALVLSLMLMGMVLAQVGVLPVVQVLHVGVAIILVAALFLWNLAASGGAAPSQPPA